ncbi:hypothetical protein PHMEG_00031538 [Phytophthora megakarya]|uniref:DUF4246 domain-containing protein n=1 Tax=Phytophthora megakarya TaxID=4795 RepID=A0A225UXU6_9STRA|nr:hypothetical protein PHMEG_00031538 [Phytophthora megakarya]
MHQLMFNGSDIVEGPDGSDIVFQWVPTDLIVTQGGDDNDFKVRCLSYINSLHPEQHKDMYKSIEDIFADLPDVISLPQKSKVSLQGKTLQVIVKFADIILTPGNPWYRGGEWHIEGTPAENIVETGIYYFDCENITVPRLELRAEIEEPFYQQNDDSGVAGTFGLLHGDRLIQEFGFVQAMTSRCVVFPNSLQHRVEPRKSLAFFLIDFNKSIPSTSVIPPQQQTWRECGFELTIEKHRLVDVEPNIRAMLPRGTPLIQAKQQRLDLMKQRSAEGSDDEEGHEHSRWYTRFFCVCEY